MRQVSKKAVINVIVFLLALPVLGQKGIEDGSRYGHGNDSIRCIKNLSLYREYIKHGNTKDAIGPWRVVFRECPTSTKNIYIDGAKMFNEFIEKEKDPVRMDAYIDTLMLVYEQRIKYFKSEKGSILGRMGVDLLRYKRDEIEDWQEGYGYLEESIKILKNNSSAPIIATFMNATYQLYAKGKLTDMQVIDNYSLVSDIIDFQLANDPDDGDMQKVKEFVDLNFIASGAPSCQSLLNYFKPQFESRKNDVSYLKKAATFLGTLDCEEDPFYAQTAEALYIVNPSASAAFNLAKLFVAKGNFNKASDYYREAIEKEKDPQMKAEYYYQLGVVTNSKLDQPEQARKYALQALNIRPNWGDPYILIGDCYVTSKNCFEDDFEKSTIYWIAVDMFNKAKSVDNTVAEKVNERIATYSKYFPDVETIFFYSLKEGDSYTVGCWINETTTVRSR